MVAMTRAQIADPFLVTKIRAGREDEVIRCIGANECSLRNFKQLDVACIMNPRRDAKRSGDMESWIPSRPRVHAGSLS